ncbi:MAG: adenylosuccinate synthase [Sphingobacteriales bacterium]|jgi:adenylosuccinate synthase
MAGVDVLLGLQWGDEGKGKIVDVLCPKYEMVARFQGGPNAGHTLEFNGQKHVLNTIPSGIFNKNTVNLIGNGVVIDPVVVKREITNLIAAGNNPLETGMLWVGKKAHLIIPTHKFLDAASEQLMGTNKIGSTLRGISPTYQDKIGRRGLRVGDVLSKNFKEKYQKLVDRHTLLLKQMNFEFDLAEVEAEWFEALEMLKQLKFVDSEHEVNRFIKEGKKVLAEGAQGTLLDIDFGSYPFVTSSNTTSAGACTGLGVAPNTIGRVFGIFKAYCTRVGSGPFPTELEGEMGEKIRELGHEKGATTGRPRRCGWIDLPALKYAIMLNGVTDLIMTKGDVLSGFDTIMACTHYMVDGEKIDFMPHDLCEGDVKPVYKEIKGWQADLTGMRKKEDLPETVMDYVTYLEKELEVKISWVSVGPDREQTITM